MKGNKQQIEKMKKELLGERKIWKVFALIMSAVAIIFGVLLIFQLLSYGRLLDENIELRISKEPKPYYTPLYVWGGNELWRFEHLTFSGSRYRTGIYDNKRYLLGFSNYDKNESFELIFDFNNNFCSLRTYKVGCGEDETYDDCFKEWRIEGKPQIFKWEY